MILDMAYVVDQDFRWSIEMTWDSEPFVVTGAIFADSVTNTTVVAQAVAEAFGVTNGFSKIQTNEIIYTKCSAYELAGLQAPGENFFATADHLSGANSSPAVSPQVALIYKLLTGLAGRANRGRLFLPGVTQAYISDPPTRWGSAQTDIVNAYNNFSAALVGKSPSMIPTVNSRHQKKNIPITSFPYNVVFGTQRRRSERFA